MIIGTSVGGLFIESYTQCVIISSKKFTIYPYFRRTVSVEFLIPLFYWISREIKVAVCKYFRYAEWSFNII